MGFITETEAINWHLLVSPSNANDAGDSALVIHSTALNWSRISHQEHSWHLNELRWLREAAPSEYFTQGCRDELTT